MPLRTIPIERLTSGDIQRLVTTKVPEGRGLDYKRDAYGADGKGTFELLKDVSALANTDGGDIIIGVDEERDDGGQPNGLPQSVNGVDISNWDKERLRLEQTIRDGLAPRVLGVHLHKLDLAPPKALVIIRVPQSLQAPHMIIAGQRSPFYARIPGASYPMDITEIRQGILRSASILDRAEAFRRNRVEQVLRGEGPVIMAPDAKVFLHILPLRALPFAIDLSNQEVLERLRSYPPVPSNGYDFRINFEGQLNYVASRIDGAAAAYVQIFRDASLEFCHTGISRSPSGPDRPGQIYSSTLEKRLIANLDQALGLFRDLTIPLPAAVFATLTSVKGYLMPGGPRYNSDDFYPIDRDHLYPPGQIVERPEQKAAAVLKPIFDSVWNAAGYTHSLNYDNDGNWQPLQR